MNLYEATPMNQDYFHFNPENPGKTGTWTVVTDDAGIVIELYNEDGYFVQPKAQYTWPLRGWNSTLIGTFEKEET